MSKPEPWVGFDFDGSLATYDGWKGWQHTGEPIPEVVACARALIERGVKVKIFTARVADCPEAAEPVRAWALQHLLAHVEVTNIKDQGMIELWDDRVIALERNTGRVLGGNSKYFNSEQDEAAGLDAAIDNVNDLAELAGARTRISALEAEVSRLRDLCAAARPIVRPICPTLEGQLRDALAG